MDKQTLAFIMALGAMLLISGCSNAGSISGESTGEDAEMVSFGINTGDIPPDFTLTTIDGKEIQLSEYKGDKPVLLYFFATWCPYCSQDFDIVKEVYPQYEDAAGFVAIDLDPKESRDLIAGYRQKKGLSMVDFAQGNAGILSDFAITHTTTKYAIGREGKILYKGSGVFTEQQWNTLFSAMAINQ